MRNKLLLGGLVASMFWTAHAPDIVRRGLSVVFFMIMVDTITAILAAIAVKELRSSRMRDKLVMKSLQYAVLIVLTYEATTLASTWIFFEGGIGAIIAIEATSMLENLSKWQKYGGSDFGSVSSVLSMISGFFQASPEEEQPHTTVTTATTIPPNPKEPIISVVSVDSFDSKGNEEDKKI